MKDGKKRKSSSTSRLTKKYVSLFTVIEDTDDITYLGLGPTQLQDFVFTLNVILRPQIMYKRDAVDMLTTLVDRSMAISARLLFEVEDALPEEHHLHLLIHQIWNDLDHELIETAEQMKFWNSIR